MNPQVLSESRGYDMAGAATISARMAASSFRTPSMSAFPGQAPSVVISVFINIFSFGILIVGRHDIRPDFCQAQLFLYAKSTAG